MQASSVTEWDRLHLPDLEAIADALCQHEVAGTKPTEEEQSRWTALLAQRPK